MTKQKVKLKAIQFIGYIIGILPLACMLLALAWMIILNIGPKNLIGMFF